MRSDGEIEHAPAGSQPAQVEKARSSFQRRMAQLVAQAATVRTAAAPGLGPKVDSHRALPECSTRAAPCRNARPALGSGRRLASVSAVRARCDSLALRRVRQAARNTRRCVSLQHRTRALVAASRPRVLTARGGQCSSSARARSQRSASTLLADELDLSLFSPRLCLPLVSVLKHPHSAAVQPARARRLASRLAPRSARAAPAQQQRRHVQSPSYCSHHRAATALQQLLLAGLLR
jgi:hypothetical protein